MEISVINETKIIIEKINNKLLESTEKYYKDILDFLNMLFDDESKSILKLKFKKILLNESILETYNYIIKKYMINKDLINIEYFNFDIDYDKDDIIKIIIIICNNLLNKINYKLFTIIRNNKKIFKIKIL